MLIKYLCDLDTFLSFAGQFRRMGVSFHESKCDFEYLGLPLVVKGQKRGREGTDEDVYMTIRDITQSDIDVNLNKKNKG